MCDNEDDCCPDFAGNLSPARRFARQRALSFRFFAYNLGMCVCAGLSECMCACVLCVAGHTMATALIN